MAETVSDTTFEQVVVTTPTGEQVCVRRWGTGPFEVDWRAVADPREVWRPVDPRDWFVEVQS